MNGIGFIVIIFSRAGGVLEVSFLNVYEWCYSWGRGQVFLEHMALCRLLLCPAPGDVTVYGGWKGARQAGHRLRS